MSVRQPGACSRGRRGYTAADLLVALGLAGVIFLVGLMAMPRGREQARLAACQRNLGQIGLALALYDQMQGRLPTTGRLPAIDPAQVGAEGQAAGPLRVLLDAFGLESFQDLAPKAPPPSAAGPAPGEVPVPGFVCSSDPNATAALFRAPISYRAATGSDPSGSDGLFASGRSLSTKQVEEADGASYTAAFAERRVGNGREESGYPGNYAVLPGPLPEGGFRPDGPRAAGAQWLGDAGSSWVRAGYPSTLYNHALAPNAPASCIARDGQTAFMGASSGHVRGVNLLMLDGSVKLVALTIAPAVWKEFAALGDPDRPQ